MTTTAAAAGSGFYHEHKYPGGDPEVMQRATEFITKILEEKEKLGEENFRQPSPQPQLVGDIQIPGKDPTKSTNLFFGDGTAKRQRATPTGASTRRKGGRLGRSRRPKSSKKAAAAVIPPVASGREFPNKAAMGENRGSLLTMDGQQQQLLQQQQDNCNQPGDIAIATRCGFLFPPGGTDEGLDEQVKGDQEASKICEDDTGCCAAGDVDRNGMINEEVKSMLELTPLAFDVFCSLRPTLLKDNSMKQSQRDPATAVAKGEGVLKNKRGEGQNASREGCPRRTSRGRERPVSASAAHSRKGIGDRTVACTWTSVFGAVCAGAERGHARAEVLKAARREASRSKQAQRRATCGAGAAAGDATAAAASGSPPNLKLVSECDTTAFGTTALALTEDREAFGRAKYGAVDAIDKEISFNVSIGKSTSKEGSNPDNDATSGENSELNVPVLETKLEGVHSGQQLTAEEDGLVCNNINAPRMCDVKAMKSCESFPGDERHARLSGGTDTDRPMQHFRSTMTTSPLVRHPFGGGTTLIGVNAPRSLQLCPGDSGLSGLGSNISRHCFSSARQRHRRAGQPPRRSSPRRPSTASGALRSGRTTTGINGSRESWMGGRFDVGVRPETAGSFFSTGCSRQGKLGDATWVNESDSR